MVRKSSSKRRGRPRAQVEQVEIMLHLRLRRGVDDDLITFFGLIPPRQRVQALKVALRAGGMRLRGSESEISDDDAADMLDGLLL